MEFIRGLHNLKPRHRGCVATMGNCDGVHLGHQAVIGQLAERAQELKLPTLVLLFEPQPQEFFRPEAAPPRLTRLREKIVALRRYSVDRVLCVRFNARFAALAAEDFIRRVLVEGLGVRYLVVGDDLRFAHDPRRDFAMLAEAGRRAGLQAGEMLGLAGEPLPGVANIGTRPTVGGTRTLLEPHLLDFADDIYGAYVHVNFLHKLRAEMRFASLDELKARIAQDVAEARAFFAQYHTNYSTQRRKDAEGAKGF